MTRAAWKILICSLALAGSMQHLFALSSTAVWQRKKLVITITDQLYGKHKKLIESGFSTFSRFQVRTEHGHVLFRVDCTVKFDTWQERYELLRLDESPTTGILNTFNEYAQHCLTARIDSRDVAGLQPGDKLVAELTLEQISIEQAERIKNWFVTQQSGFMQELFAHMIGDISLSKSTSVEVHVPEFHDSENKPGPLSEP